MLLSKRKRDDELYTEDEDEYISNGEEDADEIKNKIRKLELNSPIKQYVAPPLNNNINSNNNSIYSNNSNHLINSSQNQQLPLHQSQNLQNQLYQQHQYQQLHQQHLLIQQDQQQLQQNQQQLQQNLLQQQQLLQHHLEQQQQIQQQYQHIHSPPILQQLNEELQQSLHLDNNNSNSNNNLDDKYKINNTQNHNHSYSHNHYHLNHNPNHRVVDSLRYQQNLQQHHNQIHHSSSSASHLRSLEDPKYRFTISTRTQPLNNSNSNYDESRTSSIMNNSAIIDANNTQYSNINNILKDAHILRQRKKFGLPPTTD